MKKITLDFISDPQHGWLKVSRETLKYVGRIDSTFLTKLTRFSYERKNHVYLEEDCDAGELLDRLKRYGVKVTIKSKYSNKSSKVRSYNSLNVSRLASEIF